MAKNNELTLLAALLFALCSAACQAELDSPQVAQPVVNGTVDSSNLYPYVDRLAFGSRGVPAGRCGGAEENVAIAVSAKSRQEIAR